jgi:hypothetical protein
VVRKAQISKGITAVTDSMSERQQAIERIKSEMLRLGAAFDEKAAKQTLAYLAI